MLEREKERIVRLWAKQLRAESHEVEIPGRDLREPLRGIVDELARLLADRGEEAVRLWPEWVRSHGSRRYDQRFDPDDLAREFKVLQQVLLRVYGKRRGHIESDVAELIAELIGEATAATQASFSRSLRTEEVRFREAAVMESVLHHVDVGILVAELDGTLSFATPPAARLIGVPVRALVGARAQQLLGPILTQMHAAHPDGKPFRVQDLPLVRALKEQLPVRGVWVVLHRPDGKETMLEMSATPLWEEGGMVGVIQTVADRSETALKTKELTSAYEELRRLQGRLLQRTRTQALGQLASGAAHALNNFLNVLRLRITLLRRGFKPEHLDALDRTVRNIGDLVSRLQEFSVTRGEEELRDATFDDVVRDALQLARSELERPDAPVTVEHVLGAHGKARVDEGFLREVVVNLMLAARDRMATGGKLTVSTSRDQDWLVLTITDSGPALSEDDLARLFDPFKGKFRTPHLSLLLAVARNQVQRWGGELHCMNCNAEVGATFELRLPMSKEEQRPVPALEEAKAQRGDRRLGTTRRVLVVDDEPENARMLAELLGEEGYEVTIAHSGTDALQLWDARPFDAALLDALMPELSGWDLARELRKRSPDVLLAMVTGMDVRGQNRANLALVDAVFRKPVDVGALDDFLSQSGADAAERRGAAAGPQDEPAETGPEH